MTDLVENYKTILITYSFEQNNTLLSSIPYAFLNNLTAEIVNEPNDTRPKRPLLPIESSQLPLSTITKNPLDEATDNSDDPTNPTVEHSGMFTKRTKRMPKMARSKFFPKRKRSFNQQIFNDNTINKTLPLPNSTLSHYP